MEKKSLDIIAAKMVRDPGTETLLTTPRWWRERVIVYYYIFLWNEFGNDYMRTIFYKNYKLIVCKKYSPKFPILYLFQLFITQLPG